MNRNKLLLIIFISALAFSKAQAQTYALSKAVLVCKGTNPEALRTARKAKVSKIGNNVVDFTIKSVSCTQQGNLALMPSITHPDAEGFYINEKKTEGIILTKDKKLGIFVVQGRAVVITNAGAVNKGDKKKALSEMNAKFASLLSSDAIDKGFEESKKIQKSNALGKIPQKSTSDMAATWTSGEYKYFTNSKYGKNSSIIGFGKGHNGVIEEVTVAGSSFTLNTSDNAQTNWMYAGSGRSYLCVFEDFIYFVEDRGGFGGFSSRVYTKNGKPMKIEEAKSLTKTYETWAEAKIKSEQEAYKASVIAAKKAEEAERDRARAERRAKYGLKGKDVVKIEFVKIVSPKGYYHEVNVDLKATMKDGTTISTADKGYIEDYVITYGGANIEGYLPKKLGAGFLRGDKMTITAKCKHNPAIKTSKSVTVPYEGDIFITRNGESGWSSGSPGRGLDFIVYAKAVKHAVTGKDLIQIKVHSIDKKKIYNYKIAANRRLKITAIGGAGGSSGSNNGGRGGNITLIKDPNLRNFNFSYENHGGAGSPGGYSRGVSGKYQEKVQPVTF